MALIKEGFPTRFPCGMRDKKGDASGVCHSGLIDPQREVGSTLRRGDPTRDPIRACPESFFYAHALNRY